MFVVSDKKIQYVHDVCAGQKSNEFSDTNLLIKKHEDNIDTRKPKLK